MKNLIVDCFAGGGGASVGIEMALGREVDIAINHDPLAIRMHAMNHPKTYHYTEDIMKVELDSCGLLQIAHSIQELKEVSLLKEVFAFCLTE